MQRVVFHPPIPVKGENLQINFFEAGNTKKLDETRQNPASHAFIVGNEHGVIDVPYKPGWIFIRRKMGDGTSIVSECYVPTNEDGQTKIKFLAGQVITPKKSSDTTPNYWIYEGIAPTPETKLVPIANSWGPNYGNGHPNEDGSVSLDDRSLPKVLNVDHVYPYSAGVVSPISYKLTDTGKTDPATGQRLWKPTYTGLDFSTATQNGQTPDPTAAPQPPNDPVLNALLAPCGDPNGTIPTSKIPAGNVPNGPIIKVRVPVDPAKRQPTGGMRPAPPAPAPSPLPPGQQPQPGPDIPPTPTPDPHPPGPPTGPGQPPPSPPPPGGGGGGDGGGIGGGSDGGTWYEDGTHIEACFNTPYCIDRQGPGSINDSSQPGDSTTYTRTYYNIRGAIDAAISKLVGDRYKPRNLVSVTLMFDGIHQTTYPVSSEGGAEIDTPFLNPTVYETDTGADPVADSSWPFDVPPVKSKVIPMNPDGTLTANYQVYDFGDITVGSSGSPLSCAPLHYSYQLTTLPSYNLDLYGLLALHPEYRLYLRCFSFLKEDEGARTLPYEKDFGDGDEDGWVNGGITTVPGGGYAFYTNVTTSSNTYKYYSPVWAQGFRVTATGYNDKANDLFGNEVAGGAELSFRVTHYGDDVVVLASGSKGNFHSRAHTDAPRTYTWEGVTSTPISPCEPLKFTIYGGVFYGAAVFVKIKIEPIPTGEPQPPGAPPATGPGSNPGGSGATGSGGGAGAPINPGPDPIPAGSPVSWAPPGTGYPDADGSGNPLLLPATGESGSPQPAIGFAGVDVPPGQPASKILSSGQVGGYSGLLAGKQVYLDTSAPGGVTQTRPSGSGKLEQSLGVAVDQTTIDINIGPATLLL